MRLLLLMILLVFAGCLAPVEKLGCCQKENISEGCVLYNTSDFTSIDMTGQTVAQSCDNPDMDTEGYCNVSVNNNYRLIPICTQEDIVECVDPGCTAMVCGDFSYKPRISPVVTDDEDLSSATPTDSDDSATIQFYKSQCRFLPMDVDLRQIMKNSKSSINVFRVGIGGSFDEYDQYRYYFPMADEFCSAAISGGFSGTVDRYMNYLDLADKSVFDPDEITENCFDDDSVQGPYMNQESPALNLPGYYGLFTISTVEPEKNNYKFVHFINYDFTPVWTQDLLKGAGYQYIPGFINGHSLYKEIDKDFYKRELSIAHASSIYDIDGTGSTRAPFECSMSENNCLSGSCNSDFYNRGVFVDADNNNDIVTDCTRMKDENGNQRIICLPTIAGSIAESDDGSPPSREYSDVTAKVTHIEISTVGNMDFTYEDFIDPEADPKMIDYWDAWGLYLEPLVDRYGNPHYVSSSSKVLTNVPTGISHYYSIEYVYDDEGHYQYSYYKLNQGFYSGSYGPPAGGAVFFGKISDEPMRYGDGEVIGYAMGDDFDETLLAQNCELEENEDYVVVSLGSPTNWQSSGMMSLFRPYYEDVLKSYKTYGFEEGCGDKMLATDSVVASMPWVIAFEKGGLSGGPLNTDLRYRFTDYPNAYWMASTPAFGAFANNVYDEYMYRLLDAGSCSLRMSRYDSPLSNDYYNIVYPNNFVLLINKGDDRFGRCSLDRSTMFPELRTFGWCEPCSTSTLAYQEISTTPRPYLPGYKMKLDPGATTFEPQICWSQYESHWDFDFSSQPSFNLTDNVTCYNPSIPDISDYKGSIGNIGSPRTIPEASVMKKRLGNYLRSGVLPVLDLTDESNWNITNPDAESVGWDLFQLFYDTSPEDYSQYDFERLIGRMGAAVIIVDTVSEYDVQFKVSRIIDRASIIKQKCFGCITAFHVQSPPDNESFNYTINSVLSNPTAQRVIEMVTFDYPISEHGFSEPEDVLSDISSFGQTSLSSKAKPVMVVGLNVRSDDERWEGRYEDLFEKILMGQDDLVRNGVVGIIYSPARSAASAEGIIDTSSDPSLGLKTEKFCALQGAMEKMTATTPTTIFSKVLVQEENQCVPCTPWDYLSGGVCSDTLSSTQRHICDGGGSCTLPPGIAETDDEKYKCLEGTVTMDCSLCTDSLLDFSCIYTYANGSSRSYPSSATLPLSDLSSDIYLDIIASLPKPYKCCLMDEGSGLKYTYRKDTYQSPINKPVVFPKNGGDVDCGSGVDLEDLGESSTFCGLQQSPIRDYAINCEIS